MMVSIVASSSSFRVAVTILAALELGLREGAVLGGILVGGALIGLAQAGSRERVRHNLFLRKRPFPRCPRCSGFGVLRCTTCTGEGVVRYEKKMEHVDVCPVCVLKRYIPCTLCQGSGSRPKLHRIPHWILSSPFRNVPSILSNAFQSSNQ
mmetsp:Transcript_2074/g.3666  ORF Transcript_2074/g.3666 Transcript_2074/m.3666 type:complete len:151 (+) Transcript_2074:57-509(+)